MKPFLTPKIQDMLLKIQSFTLKSSLDLEMGYYNVELSPGFKQLCNILLPWRKFDYQKIPMWVCNSPNIFQEIISNIFKVFLYGTCAYRQHTSYQYK